MLTMYWSAKGGSGTTVVAAGHALTSASDRPTLLVDLDGDLPDVLGVPQPAAGIAEWVAAGAGVPGDALDRIAVDVGPRLRLLGRGLGPVDDPDRLAVLGRLLADSRDPTIVDLGRLPNPAADALLVTAGRSVLVLRPCYLAVSRARALTTTPTELVIVRDAGRALRDRDIADALGVPVRATVPVDVEIARAVDAGLLAHRMPRRLRRVAP